MKILAGTLILLWLAGCGGEPPKQEQAPQTPMDTMAAPMEEPMDTTMEPGTVAEPPKEEPKKPAAMEKGATVIGSVVDIVSYATAGVVPDSPAGKEITEASAKGGNPLGILEQGTGSVYIVTMKQAGKSANDALLPFLGMKITAKGDVYRKGDQQLLVMTVIGKSME
jgi:hypothetical protein